MVSSKLSLVLAITLLNGASAAPAHFSNDIAAREPMADGYDSMIYMEKRKGGGGGKGGGGRSGGGRSGTTSSGSTSGGKPGIGSIRKPPIQDILQEVTNLIPQPSDAPQPIPILPPTFHLGPGLARPPQVGKRSEEEMVERRGDGHLNARADLADLEARSEDLERRKGGGGGKGGGGKGGGGKGSGGHSSGGKTSVGSKAMSKAKESMSKIGKEMLHNLNLNLTGIAPLPIAQAPAAPTLPFTPRIGLAGAPGVTARELPEEDLEMRNLEEEFETRDLIDLEDLDRRKNPFKSAWNGVKKGAKKGANFVKNHKEEIGQIAQTALPLVLALRDEEELLAARGQMQEGFELEARSDGLDLELESRDFLDYDMDELD